MSDIQVAGDQSMSEDYQRALAEHGIPLHEEITAPEPLVPQWTHNPEELCDQNPTRPETEAESLPIRKLASQIQEGSADYPGYKNFVSVTVWHPTQGYGIINHSFERADGTVTPLGNWMHNVLKPGEAFRIGVFKTSRNFKIVRPIPVGGAEIAPSEQAIPF